MRIPKLRGFKNRFRIEFEVVNIGAIGTLAEAGAFEIEAGKKPTKAAPITINQDILRAVGLVRTLNKPLKILGAGDLSVPLFVVADAFTASARAKIEAAGGSVNVLEMPASPLAALGVTREADATEPASEKAPATRAAAEKKPAKATAPKAASKASAPKPTAAKASAVEATAGDATTKAPSTEESAPAATSADADEPAETDQAAPTAEAEPTSSDDA
jgi:hypothetical protein